MLASEHDIWTSYEVCKSDAPLHWGDVQDENIRLCDNGVDAWPHCLVSPNTFWFFFPRIPCPDRPWEQDLVCLIRDFMKRGMPLTAHLFSARSRVEFYGVWTAVALERIGDSRMLLTLQRHAKQPIPPQTSPLRKSPSFHMRVHEHYIRRSVPMGWSLCHEERVGPSVIHGRRHSVECLRCDMVLTRGCRRICVISIASAQHVTPHHISRCTQLRDRMLCRVVIVTGVPPVLEWMDFGSHEGSVAPNVHQNLEWLDHTDEDSDL